MTRITTLLSLLLATGCTPLSHTASDGGSPGVDAEAPDIGT